MDVLRSKTEARSPRLTLYKEIYRTQIPDVSVGPETYKQQRNHGGNSWRCRHRGRSPEQDPAVQKVAARTAVGIKKLLHGRRNSRVKTPPAWGRVFISLTEN